MLGLRRGSVELFEHDPNWEKVAAETISQLWHIFGSIASDIQHVGSTAILDIKAKPIIDIAIAVEDFSKVESLMPKMESNGFLRRNWDTDEQILFAIGDYSKPDGIVTHFIHVVKTNSTDWKDYVNFRNYLNTFYTIAKAYENLKIQLANENPFDKGREKYIAGKNEFIQKTIQDATNWANTHSTV